MQSFGEIPFIKPQKETLTTDKLLKMMKNEKNKIYLVLSFCSLFKTSVFISFFIIFNSLSVV